MINQRMKQLVEKFSSARILVLGDLMLDEFIWGKVSRISPEAPVPVVEVERSTDYPGGAANVVRNLCAFTKKSCVAGLVGNDEAGDKLIQLLREGGAAVEGVLKTGSRPTTRKTRIIARQQQVVRVDRENRAPLSEQDTQRLGDFIISRLGDVDAVIIEDYSKGLITQALVDRVLKESIKLEKIVTVDPNPNNPLQWSGATAVKPNRIEALTAANILDRDGLEPVERAASVLRDRWKTKYLLITLGDEGMLLYGEGNSPYHTPTRAREVFDVTGAGDTAIAVFTLALACGANGIEAAELANHAAGVVVGKLGTAILTPEELIASFEGSVG